MFMQNIIKVITKKACQSFIKIFHAFFGCLQISEGLNSKFCRILYVLGVLFLQNSEFLHPIHQPHQSLSHILREILYRIFGSVDNQGENIQ